jgi:hypothetical protein
MYICTYIQLSDFLEYNMRSPMKAHFPKIDCVLYRSMFNRDA